MKFIPCFGFSRQSLWMTLFVAVLLVSSVPLYASQATSISGEITAIDVIERAIEVDSVRYTLAQGAAIKNASSETEQILSIADLKVGQYVEFESSSNVIQSLRVFEQGRPM